MEAFLTLATAGQGDESSPTASLTDFRKNNNNRTKSPSPVSSRSPRDSSRSQFLLPHLGGSPRSLLDNGNYWKYLVGESGGKTGMVPQEPTMAATDGPSSEDAIQRLKIPKSPPVIGGISEVTTTTSSSPPMTTILPDRGRGSCEDLTLRGSNVPNCVVSTGGGVRLKSPAAESVGDRSDVERFDGKIVYNPDGSAYIIEDSEMSEGDESLEVPHLEGCIVDGRGVSLSSALPQIANAFYVSRNPALYSALYGQAVTTLLGDSKSKVPDIPIMHSYRVYSCRDNKSGDNRANGEGDEPGSEGEDLDDDDDEGAERKQPKSADYSSVPIKPILMCFMCKLSFGYTKSFVGHAMGDHSLSLSDQEKRLLSQRNVSAIIQSVGKVKDPLISFLEPMGNSVPINTHAPPPPVPTLAASGRQVPTHAQSKNDLSSSVESGLNISSLSIPGTSGGGSTPGHRKSPASSPDLHQSPLLNAHSKISPLSGGSGAMGMDLTRKSPGSGRSSVSPGNSISPSPTTPNPGLVTSPTQFSLGNSALGGANNNNGPPNFMTGTTIGVCPEHMNGRPSGVDCAKCELILNSSRMGALGSLHTRNSCKTLKCPKCNWHYKYQETLEIHMKEKHPDNETSCIYCIAGQPHPRLARGETYTCGYKPYRCEVCNYSTTTKGNLSIHMQSDKHLNNMQELQNGGVPPPDSLVQQQQQPPPQSSQAQAKGPGMSPSPSGGGGGANGQPSSTTIASISQSPKPKPTFRCDVCNYETNVARNLRIHMTSEKHTHNMMVLQQNVKHMQHLNALQQQAPFDPAALLQFHPQLSASLAAAGATGEKGGGSHQNEAALADMAYNQALLIQMMTGGQLPPHIPPELAPHMDLGLNPDTMEPPPEPPDPNPTHLFMCCVCTSYNTDSLESLSHHLTQDRTKLRESEILVLVAGNYMCKLCSYKTTLKANFQLHCKTDKHLQRLQHVNHIKEGGPRNEWKLKYLSMSNPIQVRCNACDYYTNSAHKLQLHAAHQRHEISVLIFRHVQSQEGLIHEDCRIYVCALCGFTTRVKLQLLQHTRSLKHLQLEQLHSLQRRAEGKDGIPDLGQIFRVLEQPDAGDSPGPTNSQHQALLDYFNDADKEMMLKKEAASVLKHALEKDSSSNDLNDLSCPYCTFVTDSETRLTAHLNSQHSSSGTDLSTSLSSSASGGGGQRSRNQTNEALRTTSSSSESKTEMSTMTCPLCQEPCTDRHNLETHVMQVHSVNAEGLQRLLILVNQSHWLTNPSPGRHSGGNQSYSSSGDLKSDSNDENEKDGGKSESESCQEDSLGEAEDLRCVTCTKNFRSLDDLCHHQNELGHFEIKQTPNGLGYLCWKKGCNQYFPTPTNLQIHYREIHYLRRRASAGAPVTVSEKHLHKFRCNQCSLAFKTMEKLQIHAQYHTIRDASKCNFCGRSFRSVLALQKHVDTSHSELSEEELATFKQRIASNPLILAGITGQVLDSAMNELLHKQESGRGDEEMMEIDESGDVVESGDGDSNDSGGSKDQQQLFEDYLNTQAMAEDSYNDPTRRYKCHRCKVAFTRQSYLTSHNKTLLHRKGEKLSYPMEKYLDPNRPFKCEVCKESFTQKNILLVHYNSVSHLHKLKRAMQEQAFLAQVGGGGGNNSANNNNSMVPPSPLMSPASSKGTPVTTPVTQTTTTPSTDDEDKKPYKCNICKVAYSQGSTLDIHMRSVLHQTRASKLQELALSGQIDLSKPLIEQPESTRVQDQHKKLIQEMLSPKGDGSFGSNPTPASSSSPTSSSSPQTTLSSISPAQAGISCQRCGTVCNSQEGLLQHQHLYCLFSANPLALFPPLPSPNSTSTPNTSLVAADGGGERCGSPSMDTSDTFGVTRFVMPSRKSSQLYKHILESYGFEIVMQFNEYHQKRRRDAERGGEEEDEGELDERILKEFPELAKSTCPFCKKVFSSVWILKSHCEEIHKDVVSMETLESFADIFRSAYMKKLENSGSSGETNLYENGNEEITTGGNCSTVKETTNQSTTRLTAPSPPTASVTPASSSESVSGGGGNNTNMSSTPIRDREARESRESSGVSFAQQMNDVQAALASMAAASQLSQHFNPMMNPMMMASLGMGLPLGLNMNALAAMNLQPPLVPMMMPSPFDHGMNQNLTNQQNAALFSAAAAALENHPREQHSKQQQQQQQQQGGSQGGGMSAQQQQQQQQQSIPPPLPSGQGQQKRARTRITDDQLKILRAHFDINNSPSEDQISQMAAQSGLPPKVIKHWFRNTLFKERQRNKDSPYNFSNPPSTTLNLEEYEKTGEAKVKAIDPEDQKQYENPTPTPPPPPVKKEPSGKKAQQNQERQSAAAAAASLAQQQQLVQHQQQLQQQLLNSHLQALQQHHQDTLSAYSHHPDLHEMLMGGEFSETESRSEEDHHVVATHTSKPKKTPKAPAAKKLKMDPDGVTSPGGSLNLSMGSGAHAHESSSLSSSPSPQQMLPPPKGFATPTSLPTNPNNLLSLASPVNLNSPGSSSGRGESASMTTPPLSNCPSQSSGKRANRTRFTDYQIKVLQEFFENNAYPKDDDLEYLSKLLGLSPRVIVVWFQNARQKARKVYENQPPVDAPEEGAGRFQRTPGLNYQCKKCLLVFQRYYELIRHQKTHCFKEEDAKRSAQAQAAAAIVAAAMSSEDSNCSGVTDNNSLTSSCGPSPGAMVNPNCNSNPAGISPGVGHFGGSNENIKTTPVGNSDESFQCEKCNLVFSRFELWREHQLVHLMNPNLFPSFTSESPFGILQQHAQTQQPQHQQQQPTTQSHAQQQQQLLQQQIKMDIKMESNKESQQSPSETSSIAGDGTSGKRKWSADEHTEDDEVGHDGQARDKRLRTTILPEQLDYLYQKYQIESNPSRKMLETIAREVGLKKRVVQVWFQNTRARERKGQFRAHAQVINKRCPFCPALFKVKSALETHLAAKHADQYSKGEINIDAIPDEEYDGPPSPLTGGDSSSKGPIGYGSHPAPPGSPSPNIIMAPFLHSLSAHAELESNLTKLYEESLKRYAAQVQHQQQGTPSHNGRSEGHVGSDLRLLKSESAGTTEFPLDLSKPVDLSRGVPKAEDSMDNDYMSDGEFDDSHDSPNSPASSTASTQKGTGGGSQGGGGGGVGGSNAGKRFRTQMSSLQVKVMKNLFADYKTPTMAECEMLGEEIGLPKRVVQVWFQNARAKEKKAKLNLQKAGLVDPNDPPLKALENCKLCDFSYSHKYSIQDHIFTRRHIDVVKASIQSGKSEKKRKVSVALPIPPPPPPPSHHNGLSTQNTQSEELLQLLGLGTTSPALIHHQAKLIATGSETSNPMAEKKEENPRNILESLNIIPNPHPHLNQPDSVSTNRTSSPSGGIRSEMEYVVEKIAALANTQVPTTAAMITANENNASGLAHSPLPIPLASSQSLKMSRPRGGMTRTLLNKIEKDKELAAMDKTKWYAINQDALECLSPEIARKFDMMGLDEETSEFLERSIENSDNLCWQIWVNMATSVLSWFLQPTSINGLLGRGSMQVFSKAQFRALIDWDGEMKGSLMDVGAGDGATTAQMSPCFSNVFVTEMSSPMKRVLTQRGFSVLDVNSWTSEEREYDMISCLNVLDRCDEPLSLLDKMKGKLSPTGVAVVAFVIPFKPYVEFGSKTHQPKELLPIKGTSFEIEVVNFVEKVLKPNGWELIKWSRVPYLCDGDIHQAYYWLSDAVFIIRPTNYTRTGVKSRDVIL